MLDQKYLKSILNYNPDTGIFTWIKSPHGRISVGCKAGTYMNGYISIKIDQIGYYAHRLAWLYMTGEWPSVEIDHKNRKRDDNKWKNLRLASLKDQMGNTKLWKNNTSGFRGVGWNKQYQMWQARLRKGKDIVVLGYSNSPEGAAEIYNTEAGKYFGEYFTKSTRRH